MAIRVRHSVILDIAEDTLLKNKLFSTDPTLAQVTIDTYYRSSSGRMNVAIGATESVPLGDVTAPKGVYLKADGACTIKINGSSDGIALVPGNAGASDATAKVLIEATITAVTVTAGATAVNLTYALWGDTA